MTDKLKIVDPRPRLLFPELSENPWEVRTGRVAAAGTKSSGLSTLELCAGGGGQALGLEGAGIEHAGLVELDPHACATLRLNRPEWNVIEGDLNRFDGAGFKGVDIISGGLPCPPFSVAGKQLGEKDERNLFPVMVRLVDQIRPKAVMIENVRGMLDAVFVDYRKYIATQLKKLGYQTGWRLMNASDFGVSQLRPRVFFVALQERFSENFHWPNANAAAPVSVGELLYDLMASEGWKGASAWRDGADDIAPTVVGGSHKHGGPDLGPTRARNAWAALGVDGKGIADAPPPRDFVGMPRLTVRMVARVQGFPDDWVFAGKKTASYRQVGNALPPPFAKEIASQVRAALSAKYLSKARA